MVREQGLDSIKGVGPVLVRNLSQLGVNSVEDLIDYFPKRYDDYSQETPIAELQPGQVTIQATISKLSERYVRRGMHITEAVANDASSSVRLIWFNQPYRAKSFKDGAAYFVSGQFGLNHQRLSIMNPSVEMVSDFPINTARLVPIYRESKSVSSIVIRKILKEISYKITSAEETLPQWLIKQHALLSRGEALFGIHFPRDAEHLTEAKRRLGFEEVFQLTLAALLNKQANQTDQAVVIPFKPMLAKDFVSHLPFRLTDDQRKVTWQIYKDMAKPQPMNRLVEGDVGSGKTVVATMAALMAMEQGFQVALMAPTELLARQHANTIHRMLEPLGYAPHVGLLVGGMKEAQKKSVRQHIASGEVRFIIGTHALIQQKVDMHTLGLVIVDEQHRFGVEQRKSLQAKAGHAVHMLSMTATPIPRSLALTLYGELDVSVIKQKPADRLPIITKICSPNSTAPVYNAIRHELSLGRQLFVVCPLVSESDGLKKTKSAEAVYEQLKVGELSGWNVGLLHGQLKADEKERVMDAFIDKGLDVIVATTVIEVGVDVPNATVMLIENAERFGLAQLHQLRGRVGRSQHQGYCFLMMSDSAAPSKRLLALERSTDGFSLAELDLELRGPGAIYGVVQHGQLDLRVAKLSDVGLIATARSSAQAFIDQAENLLHYKHLAERVKRLRAVTNLN